MIDKTHMIPGQDIRNPEVKAYAEEAERFLTEHDWCHAITEMHLAYSVAGVLAVFLCNIIAIHEKADDSLWVIVGDLPAAYLVCDNAPTWQAALEAYCEEMQRWVDAVRAEESVDELIPVNVEPTRAHADLLESRLDCIRAKFISAQADSLEGDT